MMFSCIAYVYIPATVSVLLLRYLMGYGRAALLIQGIIVKELYLHTFLLNFVRSIHRF